MKRSVLVVGIGLLLIASTAISSPAGATPAQGAQVVKQLPVTVLAGYQQATSEQVDSDDYTTTYVNQDGSHTTFVSLVPSNVEIDGEWQPASDVLQVDGDSITASEHPLDLIFGAEANDGVSANWRGSQVDFHLRGADAADADASDGGDTVTYADAISDADLEYQLKPASVKETIRLDSLPSLGVHSWSWDIHAPGLQLTKNEFDDLVFNDSNGVTKFHIPAPIAWDSSGEAEVREPAMANLASTITPLGNDTFRLNLSVSRAWLEDSSRVYPVSVDPTLTAGDTYIHAWKSDGATRTDYMHVGNTRENNTNKFWRSQAKYVYTSLAGKQIIGASFVGTYVSGTTSTQTGSVNVATCYGYTCVGAYLGDLTVGSASGTDNNSKLAQQYASWVDAGAMEKSLMLRGYEGGSYTYKALDTKLKLTWKDFPSATTPVAPSPTSGSASTEPTLEVSTTGADVQEQYVVSTQPGSNAPALLSTGWGLPSQDQIPARTLTPGVTYYWHAEVRDKYDGYFGVSTIRSSEVWSFTASNVAPSAPQIISVVPSIDDEGTLRVGTSPAFSAAAADDDSQEVRVDFQVWDDVSGQPGNLIATCESAFASIELRPSCTLDSPLSNGSLLHVRARSNDGYEYSAWSDYVTVLIDESVDQQGAVETQVEIPFDHAVSLGDAVDVMAPYASDVLGYRFESDDLVGEWYSGGTDASTFLSEFSAAYDTVPAVVAVIVDPQAVAPHGVSALRASGSLDLLDPAEPIVTGKPLLSPAAADGPAVTEFGDVIDTETAAEDAFVESGMISASHTWGSYAASIPHEGPTRADPNTARVKIEKSGTAAKPTVTFNEYYLWDGVRSSTKLLNSRGWGAEFEVNLWGTHYDAYQLRCYNKCANPVDNVYECTSAAKNYLVAKNYNWYWTVYVRKASGAKQVPSLHAYADYNDYGDECNRNSITIGLQYPEFIPAYSTSDPSQHLYIRVVAPKGTDPSDKVSAGVSFLDRLYCSEHTWMSLTDCMGVNTAMKWNVAGPQSRAVLGVVRKWRGPNLCWLSAAYGVDSRKVVKVSPCGPVSSPW